MERLDASCHGATQTHGWRCPVIPQYQLLSGQGVNQLLTLLERSDTAEAAVVAQLSRVRVLHVYLTKNWHRDSHRRPSRIRLCVKQTSSPTTCYSAPDLLPLSASLIGHPKTIVDLGRMMAGVVLTG